ncbi:MAG TPA: hypothetical protein DEF45_13115 [Rhodopirellula sp.]|nr:hypothetical protein [Rhodopirellula sp.]
MRDLSKIAVQGPSNQVEKTQLEYAVRSRLRETGVWITFIMVIHDLDFRFGLPLIPMGVDDAPSLFKIQSDCGE